MNKNFKSLDDWLEWQQTLHPKNIDFKLERIKAVYKKLQLKKIAQKIIIIAGTNGKGSTASMLESILHENQLKVGVFTSPHILSYNERIKINKQHVHDDEIIEAFNQINEKRGNITLTYFEFATLTAFYLFNKSNLDYAVLEVGLGGRLDATNIIDSDISIITSISIDHTEYLGSTIDSIALEKAGVMRPFSFSIYAQKKPPKVLFKYAQNNKTYFKYNDKDFNIKIYDDFWTWRNDKFKISRLPMLPLIGSFQYDHAGAVLSCLSYIESNLLENKQNLVNGFKNLDLLGRYQIIQSNPEIILDVAHNADAAKKLNDNLSNEISGKTLAVLGVLNDKDVYELVKPLKKTVDQWFCGTINSHRGMNADEIKHRLSTLISGESINSFTTISNAYENAIKTLNHNDRLIIYGSFYTVSEVLNHIKSSTNKVINL
ncbi:MAG: bifunctional tetrahydrofolate synthase/dihydrofolate synthase [Gammaproteobacteria bacterium]|nr:bifunctional tetrahydrofolate synthase/dihydrofolate synthase [Gammaproteobacteria bacterium]|tara:strand:+ start:198231 stop:199523 length:1293 start_codon:yes stop_codon:yes gene_type:complete